jgi:phospholipid-binding lipoprotein MlaA
MACRRKVKAVLIARGYRKIRMFKPVSIAQRNRRLPGFLMAACAVLALSACGPGSSPSGISDPYEVQNRAVHRFNVGLDKALLRPVATTAVKVVPPAVDKAVVNFAENLELPGTVVNNILQLRLGKAVENTLRFAINTTVGIGGIFDPAAAAGVQGKPTDFGETLHVWGIDEGNYFELPFFGPSTDRDAFGTAVDLALNPLQLILPNDSQISVIAQIASRISDRGRYSETFDSILYESADSYAQARLLYLQNRRFELGQAPSDESFEDPYAE